jgi:hypothetical protein
MNLKVDKYFASVTLLLFMVKSRIHDAQRQLDISGGIHK